MFGDVIDDSYLRTVRDPFKIIVGTIREMTHSPSHRYHNNNNNIILGIFFFLHANFIVRLPSAKFSRIDRLVYSYLPRKR